MEIRAYGDSLHSQVSAYTMYSQACYITMPLPWQLECPVCREAMLPPSSCLDVVRQVQLDAVRSDDVINFTPSSKLKAWQKEMSLLFWQQKQKGGVIDPNSEDDVIDESWVSLYETAGDVCECDEDGILLFTG